MFRSDALPKAPRRRISGWISRSLPALASVALASAGHAQALSCTVPAALPRPHADTPSTETPRRLLATASYTLAITWAPQFCREHGADSIECGGGNRFGFVLHGLWPDGPGKDWPQYCRPVALLAEPTLRSALCATPSVQLLQHEYAKHGSCMDGDADAYFRRSIALFRALRFPDMATLSRRPGLTAGAIATAFAARNRGMTRDMLRVTATRQGWLDELWLCLDLRFRAVRCPAAQGGLAPSAPIQIFVAP